MDTFTKKDLERMNRNRAPRRIVLGIILVVVASTAVGAAMYHSKHLEQGINIFAKTEVTSTEKFRDCIDEGGVANLNVTPNSCNIRGVTYFDADK